MNIVFIPVQQGAGKSTTTSLLTCMHMATKQQKECVFIPVGDNSEKLSFYLGIDDVPEDVTMSLSQAYKLVELGEISDADLRAYATPTVKHMDLFNLHDASLDDKSVTEFQSHLLGNMPYDYVFTHLTYPVDSPKAEAVIETADLIIYCMDHSNYQIKLLEKLMAHPLLERKHPLVVVNGYNQEISSQKAFLRSSVIPEGETFFLNYNALIPQYMEKGETVALAQHIVNGHILILDVANGLERLTDILGAHSGDFFPKKTTNVIKWMKGKLAGGFNI